jgi:tRNA dimethylallyltransferase
VNPDRPVWPIVFLMGPTASGKTRLAMELAERFPLRVISVDSAMVYRGMDIGTGKPDPAALRRVPHRLIDIRDPHETYSAADFRRDAVDAIAQSRDEGRIPFLVGGTGLYFRALRDGLSVLPSADRDIRARLEAQAAEHGWAHLHRRLEGVDPEAAARINANDPQRIQRALEVFEATGAPMSRLLAGGERVGLGEPVHGFILEPDDRTRLHADIAARFHDMLDAGLVEEVRGLRQRWSPDDAPPSMRAVGYRQVDEFLGGRSTHGEMVEKAVAATRQLARRQLTWLRAETGAERFDCHGENLSSSLRAALERAISDRKKDGLDTV